MKTSRRLDPLLAARRLRLRLAQTALQEQLAAKREIEIRHRQARRVQQEAEARFAAARAHPLAEVLCAWQLQQRCARLEGLQADLAQCLQAVAAEEAQLRRAESSCAQARQHFRRESDRFEMLQAQRDRLRQADLRRRGAREEAEQSSARSRTCVPNRI